MFIFFQSFFLCFVWLCIQINYYSSMSNLLLTECSTFFMLVIIFFISRNLIWVFISSMSLFNMLKHSSSFLNIWDIATPTVLMFLSTTFICVIFRLASIYWFHPFILSHIYLLLCNFRLDVTHYKCYLVGCGVLLFSYKHIELCYGT